VRPRPYGAAHVNARHLRQHEVEQDDVGLDLVEELQGLDAVTGHRDPETLIAQSDEEGFNEGLLVLGQQYADRAVAARARRALLAPVA
jgi:hypothetical protein